MSTILLTGGFGYIGSHTASFLAEKNKDFLIYDNFLTSKYSVLERLEKTIGKNIKYVDGDIKDTENLTEVLKKYEFCSPFRGFEVCKRVYNKPNEVLRDKCRWYIKPNKGNEKKKH